MNMASSQSTNSILLSVVVITKNEADRIGKLLESAGIADEIVVVDSGSSDDTVGMCQSHGARVVSQEWLGYTQQKQFAMDLARGEWILNLDADEALSADSAAEIIMAVKNAGPEVKGFSMPRLSWYLNRWIRHGGWYPDRKIRLVRRGFGKWTGDGLHERLEVSGEVRELGQPLLHYVYRDISDQVRTINRFSTITADHRNRPASAAYVLLGLVHAFVKFLECAVWKLGFLDGIPGLVIAVNSAFYVFLKHAKAWEKGLPKTTPDLSGPSSQ
jgi:glycosyltransferase involved in cell wall biosynthesis